jgi:hypothetical protein
MREISTLLRARRALPRHNAPARARSVVSRARRSHRSLPLETRPEPRVVRGLPERSFQNARPPVATRAMSDSSAQRVRVGPFAVSVDKQKPLIGAKISKVRRVGPVVHSRTRATRLSPPAPANEGSRSPTSSGRTRRRRPFESSDEKCVSAWCRRERNVFCPIRKDRDRSATVHRR